jgi:ribonuclease HI
MDSDRLYQVYEGCDQSISFPRAILPIRISQKHAFAILEGNRPTRDCLSSDAMPFPKSALLALQGMVIINKTLTTPRDEPMWRPVIDEWRASIQLQPRDLNEDPDREIIVATDGGCKGNGTDHAVAAWAFLIDNYVARSGMVPRVMLDENEGTLTTIPISPSNIRAELIALLMALRLIYGTGLTNRICVFTDSQFAIDLMTKYIPQWEAKGGEEEFGKKANPDLSVLLSRISHNIGRDRIRYKHTYAHQDNKTHTDPGTLPSSADDITEEQARFMNRIVDQMATALTGPTISRSASSIRKTKQTKAQSKGRQ